MNRLQAHRHDDAAAASCQAQVPKGMERQNTCKSISSGHISSWTASSAGYEALLLLLSFFQGTVCQLQASQQCITNIWCCCGLPAAAGGLCCCSGCACSHRSQWYDKYFAYNMAVGMEDYEAAIRPVKQQLFNQLLASLPQQPLGSTSRSSSSSSASIGTGSSRPPYSVLEVGIGTGELKQAFSLPGL